MKLTNLYHRPRVILGICLSWNIELHSIMSFNLLFHNKSNTWPTDCVVPDINQTSISFLFKKHTFYINTYGNYIFNSVKKSIIIVFTFDAHIRATLLLIKGLNLCYIYSWPCYRFFCVQFKLKHVYIYSLSYIPMLKNNIVIYGL